MGVTLRAPPFTVALAAKLITMVRGAVGAILRDQLVVPAAMGVLRGQIIDTGFSALMNELITHAPSDQLHCGPIRRPGYTCQARALASERTYLQLVRCIPPPSTRAARKDTPLWGLPEFEGVEARLGRGRGMSRRHLRSAREAVRRTLALAATQPTCRCSQRVLGGTTWPADRAVGRRSG